MARTHKIQKAHDVFQRARELSKQFKDSEIPGYANAEYNQNIKELERTPFRYGNHRKWIANAKVTDRRIERKKLNRNIAFEE